MTLFEFSWGPTLAATPVLLPAIGYTIGIALIAYGVYELAVYAQGKFNDTPDCEEPEKVNDQNQRPPLVEPRKKPSVKAEPNNLEKQLSLEEAKHKPSQADDEIMARKIKDPNFPPKDWKKCAPKIIVAI